MDALNNLNLENGKMNNPTYKLELVEFSPRVQKIIGRGRIYILKYNNTIIFLGYKSDIVENFREILKEKYGTRYLLEYPDCFFKEYIHKEFLKSKEATQKIEEKKKKYYVKHSIEKKKRLIEKLKNQIKEEEQKLKELKEKEKKEWKLN